MYVFSPRATRPDNACCAPRARPQPVRRARTQLCYGERLHRARRRSDAREQLTHPLHTFEQLAADPWAERVRRELRATGVKTRRARSHPIADTLTAAPGRVAEAAAEITTSSASR